ncbi:tRNA-dihydrouridine synthase [Boletus reticuloceps]|uniref:tRNA-dihydrouridine synthase n=1 Tax=Boletus reticuloceps TaxID=495285 RepID=A0A8I3A3Q4_9AGAM|nr:tRNA-dihydrouridine synthase [Boletus reticuloceps]
MGAALLTNPDLLCAILTALRRELPVSAKIRLLPTQEETKKKLVARMIRTGVSALMVHCRTRNMRQREAALVNKLREIVEDIAIIENGDRKGWEDARRVKRLTTMRATCLERGQVNTCSHSIVLRVAKEDSA